MAAVKGDEIIYPGVSAVHTNKHQVAHVSSPDAVSVCLPVGWSIQNGDHARQADAMGEQKNAMKVFGN